MEGTILWSRSESPTKRTSFHRFTHFCVHGRAALLFAGMFAVLLSACGGTGDATGGSGQNNNGQNNNLIPTVSLTAPALGATVFDAVIVAASVSDNAGVAGIQFMLDGANLGAEDTSAPYSVSWDTTQTSDGSHTLTAVARDAAGNAVTSAPVTVTISNATTTSASAVLMWDANTETDVAGYRVYYGTSPGKYEQAKGQGIVASGTSHIVTGLTSGLRYYFTVTAFDASGNESGYAAEIYKDILSL